MAQVSIKNVTDLVLARLSHRSTLTNGRDAWQSKASNRGELEDKLAIATVEQEEQVELIKDEKKFGEELRRDSSEFTYGGEQDVKMSFVGEDPVVHTREVAKAMPDIPQSGLLRSEKLYLYDDVERQLLEDAIELHADNGVEVLETYSYANNPKEFDIVFNKVKEIRARQRLEGVPEDRLLRVDLRVSVTPPDNRNEPDEDRAFTTQYYKDFIKKMIKEGREEGGSNIIELVTVKDAIGRFQAPGVDNAAVAVGYVKAFQEAVKEAHDAGDIDRELGVSFHSHGQILDVLKAVYKQGARVELADGFLAGGTSHTRGLDFIDMMMQDEEHLVKELKSIKGVKEKDIPNLVKAVQAEYKESKYYKLAEKREAVINAMEYKYMHLLPVESEQLTPAEIERSGIGGGASSYFVSEMKKVVASRADHGLDGLTFPKMKELTCEQAAYFRVDIIGEPHTLTPYSKNAGDNAIQNTLTKLKLLKAQGINPEDVTKEKFNAIELPIVGNWQPTMIKHVCSGFGEQDLSFQRGKGDIAARDVALYTRTFEHLSGFGALSELKAAKLIDSEKATELLKKVSLVVGISEIQEAYKSVDKLSELRGNLVSVEGKKAKEYESGKDYIQNLRTALPTICLQLGISDEVANVLLDSLKPGKFKIPGKAAAGRATAYQKADAIIETQLREFNEEGKPITLELQKKNQKLIDSGRQVEIPGNDEMAINRFHIATLIGTSRQQNYTNLIEYQRTGKPAGTIQPKVERFTDIERLLLNDYEDKKANKEKSVYGQYIRFEAKRADIQKFLEEKGYGKAEKGQFSKERLEQFMNVRIFDFAEKDLVKSLLVYARKNPDLIKEMTADLYNTPENKQKIIDLINNPIDAAWGALITKCVAAYSRNNMRILTKPENEKAITEGLEAMKGLLSEKLTDYYSTEVEREGRKVSNSIVDSIRNRSAKDLAGGFTQFEAKNRVARQQLGGVLQKFIESRVKFLWGLVKDECKRLPEEVRNFILTENKPSILKQFDGFKDEIEQKMRAYYADLVPIKGANGGKKPETPTPGWAQRVEPGIKTETPPDKLRRWEDRAQLSIEARTSEVVEKTKS